MHKLQADWVNGEDARLEQALAYLALAPEERADFRAVRAKLDELAHRDARKRQRLVESGAGSILCCGA